MKKEQLLEILLDQKETFLSRKDLITRDIQLDAFISTHQIVVISGVRRCGKSSLLSLIRASMQLEENEFCYFNFDDERIIPDVSLLNDLYTLHLEIYRTEPILFFDEIQVVKGWEKFVSRLYEQGRKIFVTGSNATLLSSEISTSLTGRNRVIELYPFSFSEYLRYRAHTYDLKKISVKQRALLVGDFNRYLEAGGFPIVLKENDMEIVNGWFQDILYRDIVARYRLTQVEEVRQMALYLLSNVGKLFSYATLKRVSGVKSLSSVKDYLIFFESSYLFYYLRKFDYSVKKQIMNSRKVYVIDNAVANRLGFRFSDNQGRLLENTVFLTLKRRGAEIYYHSNKYECDFLVKENLTIVEAIQVVYTLNADNFKRELNGLLEAMRLFRVPKGTIITMDKRGFEGDLPPEISVVNAWEWMLGCGGDSVGIRWRFGGD